MAKCTVRASEPWSPGHRWQRPIKTVDDLASWLDQLLAALAIERAALIGHSYGAWIALRYALHAPSRVDRMVLLDPTDCFTALSLRYRLRAIPMLVQPSARRMSRFLAWETRGRPLNPAWLAVVTSAHDLGRASIVIPKRPRPADLAGLDVPTLVVVAARSRAHTPAGSPAAPATSFRTRPSQQRRRQPITRS
jgi:pimeloyl-ACP methyl ester carboxylesterase